MGYITIPDQYKEILGMTADDYAKKQTSALTQQAQEYLNDYDKIAEQRKNALNTNKQNTVQQIQQQIPQIQEQAKQQSRQAYINNMLAQKDMGQKLSQAGLSTTGVVGSAYSDLANSYGENVNQITLDKNNALRNVDNQVNSANLDFVQKEQELLADIDATRMEVKKYNDQLAMTKYQQAIENYDKFKQYEQYVNSYNAQQAQWEAEERAAQREYQLNLQQLELNKQKLAEERAARAQQQQQQLSLDTSQNQKEDNSTYAQRFAYYLLNNSNQSITKNALFNNKNTSNMSQSEKEEIAQLLRERGRLIE